MKQQIDPKVGIFVVVIVLVIVGGFYALRGKAKGNATAAEQASHLRSGNQMMQYMQQKSNTQPGPNPNFDPKSFKPAGTGQ